MDLDMESRLRRLLGEAPKGYWEEPINHTSGYWGERILSQLVYAYEISKINGHQYDDVIHESLTLVEREVEQERMIGKSLVVQAEGLLQQLASEAKSYDVLCVAHAHIDMNWKWGWDETVSITLDTFNTMLQLMKEYPLFTFSQSQAAIYRIVEQYAPDMLNEIKLRIKEGRWEVTASHWVEADKNMPNGESLTRQILYTKRYLSTLLDIDPEGLNIDYEPDTFGHSVHVPEILTNGGVKYYYHCRGYEGNILYRWKAPSGQSVIVYREPTWYNDRMHAMLGAYVPDNCRQTGLKTHLHVYGVGDHGGGPTRRDLERMIDMADWPIYPQLRFGSYADYFKLCEPIKDTLPIVEGELNVVFTGCYTSQSRIKTANRTGEAVLNEAEAFGAIAHVATGSDYPRESLETAWRHLLFNQFHDILPGSGVLQTREHALGLFQETMALANTSRKRALEHIAAEIDTSGLGAQPTFLTTSEGAGGGYGIKDFTISQVERGRGNKRIVHLFNSSAYDREEKVQIILWDWNSPIRELLVKDESGAEVAYQIEDQNRHAYWGHDYLRLLIVASAPAFGYSTYTIEEGKGSSKPVAAIQPRVEGEERFVLENELLKVVFHPAQAAIVSMIHKSTGEELVDARRPAALFRLIQEDPSKGMSAWRVGRYMQTENLHTRSVKFKWISSGQVRQALQYEIAFASSTLKVTVALDKGSDKLDFLAECDWHEIGKRETTIPQLNFLFPFAYESLSYKYDVPYGTVVRKPQALDVPGNSWAMGLRTAEDQGKPHVMLITSNKYGFRGTDNSLAVSLIRSSFDPDPYPETGNHHRMKFAICVTQAYGESEWIESAYRWNHPLNVLSGTPHSGTLPLTARFLKVEEGTAAVSAVKAPEDSAGKMWIVRLYETNGQATVAKLQTLAPVVEVFAVDGNEHKLEDDASVQWDGHSVSIAMKAYTTRALCIRFG